MTSSKYFIFHHLTSTAGAVTGGAMVAKGFVKIGSAFEESAMLPLEGPCNQQNANLHVRVYRKVR